jgi:hypothetical protein
MAMRGNLRDFSITQLLNLINLAGKTGMLVIEGPAGAARMSFRNGKLAYAQIAREENDLAAILQRSRKINTAQVQLIRERASRMSDKELGLLLINAGYLTQTDILESLQIYCMDIVRRMFSWLDGVFHFDQEAPLPDGRIPVRIDLENLIIEGSRRLREYEQLQEELPSLDMALKFVDRPGATLKNLNLSVEEWRVVRYVSPKNSMRQIAMATRMNDQEIRRVVYSLLQAGVVEMIRPASAPQPTPPEGALRRTLPVKNPDEKRSLLNRLITRIRSI